MNKRIIISIVIGTFILFAWNAFSWMVLPFHSNTLNNIPENSIDSELLQKTLTEDGVYHFPGLPTNNSENSIKEVERKLSVGPRITLMVYKNGSTKLFNPNQFFGSLILNLLTVLLTFYLLTKLKLKTLKPILLTCITIGLLIGIVSDFGQMNWFMFPLEYTIINLFDRLISFSFLGLLFGLFAFKKRQNV
jgi:hypothetical protein